jgi:dTDP-4-dehydrorhamnose reductase
MRVLVIGATGLLGKVLMEEWDQDICTGVGAEHIDIRDASQVSRLFETTRPGWTVLAAAYTDVDGCEQDRQRAFQVNCFGAVNVAHEVARTGSKLLFVSTDYVFDGSKHSPYEPGDALCPVSIYGQSKAEAERLIRGILPECCIVRTAWLFGAIGRCFPNKILELSETQKRLRVVADQVGTPTFNRDLARVIVQLVRSDAKGIVHATNTGPCTWHEFACEILRVAGHADVSVEAIRTEDMPRPAPRPKYSVLSSASLGQYQLQMRPWRDTLKEYFADRETASSQSTPLAARPLTVNLLPGDSEEVQ